MPSLCGSKACEVSHLPCDAPALGTAHSSSAAFPDAQLDQGCVALQQSPSQTYTSLRWFPHHLLLGAVSCLCSLCSSICLGLEVCLFTNTSQTEGVFAFWVKKKKKSKNRQLFCFCLFFLSFVSYLISSIPKYQTQKSLF